MRVLLLALAGAAGVLTRYGVATAIGVRTFPWVTLGINVVGSFLLGVLLELGPARMGDDVRVALGVGFFGAFTTFSTFSYETVTMLRDGRWAAASCYVLASVIVGLGAAMVGYRVGASL